MRRVVATLAALFSIFIVVAPASAAPITFPADPGFTAGSSWTATSSCGLLCTVNGTQPATGGNPGAQAVADYATVANVIGLASGSVDFTSAAFGWTGDSPAGATLHLDRRATVGTLVSVNGAVGATVQLLDTTASTTATLKTINYTANLAWTGMDVTVPPSLLIGGHSYRLRIHTTFSALVAVLGGATVAYDNVSLAATRAAATVSGTVVGTPTQTAVSIGATIDTAGANATYHVEYGTTTSYGSATTDAAFSGAASPGAVGVNLTGLAPGTTYHARLVVTTDAGTTNGPDVTFTTAANGAPPVTTPTISVPTATVLGARAADLSAMIDLNGLTGTQYRYEYGTTTSYGSATTLTAVPAAGSNGWSVASASLTTLTPGTTYHVRAAVLDGGSWTYGDDITFTTAPARAPAVGAPTVTATDTAISLGADITPNSADADWVVEWGTTSAYGSTSSPVTLLAGDDPVRALYTITGLTADTDYHVRFKAISQDGTTYGADTVIHTAVDPNAPTTVPTVGSASADVRSPRAADLSATVDLNGLTGADYRFEYGTTTAYGAATAVTAVPAAGADGASALAASLTGLTPGTTYHVRASVRVNGTWTDGADVTFTTAAAVAPSIASVSATKTTTTARLTAAVTPHSAATQWTVQYGPTTAYGSTSAPVTLPAGASPVAVALDLAGLTADTTYHYRFVATSADGTDASADRTLRTDAEDDGGATAAEGIDGGATQAGGVDAPAAAPAAPVATPAATPSATPVAAPACRAVTILARSRGIAVRMERFVTAGAPLAVTPRAKARNTKRVTFDGKVVKATTKGRSVRLAAAALRLGRHTLAIGTGSRAARLKVSVGTCAASLAVRSAAGRTRVVLAAVPGTRTATFTLPKAYIKALVAGTLSIRSDGRTASAKIAKRAQRTAATVTVTGLPANVTEVRLTLATTKRLAASAVTATVATAQKTARLKARAIGTRTR